MQVVLGWSGNVNEAGVTRTIRDGTYAPHDVADDTADAGLQCLSKRKR